MVLAAEKGFSFQEDGSFIIACLLDTEGKFQTEFGIEDEDANIDVSNEDEEDYIMFSAIARFNLEQSQYKNNMPILEFKFVDYPDNTALVRSQVFGILEYSPEKVLITVYPSKILIIDNWQQIHKIEDPRIGNDQKYFITPMPNFDSEKFPFLVCSGYETLNFINVKELRTEVLIKAPVRNVKS